MTVSGGLFSVTTLLGLLCGVAVGGGLALLVVALRGLPPTSAEERAARQRRRSELAAFFGRRGTIAVATAVAVLLLTRWPIAALATALLAFMWNQLFGGAAEERAAMRRVEALAGWTESLRDTIAGAVGLEQAIPSSARAASPALRGPLNNLVDRLRARTPLPDALQEFADELDDSSADVIIASLILNARLRGPGLREVLGALAKSAREEVDMRQRVMAQRASTRRSVQIVVGVSVAFPLGLAIFNPGFVEPFGDPLGQAVLAVVCGLFGLGFWWMRRLSTIETPERFLARGEPVEALRERDRAGGVPDARLPGGFERGAGR
ncbi:type II secretion system F family protein [Streptomyces sedi]|uniref:Type II secretion system protein n=1 Tax=Streptomyces sedi TaxID=555059 RepID=A0A5C4VGG2_9ACTN|nr:type II secretion system F family protein [Streptomyces sedi]TNM34516.1 type II secretion system protein [Streptomyces sedi]